MSNRLAQLTRGLAAQHDQLRRCAWRCAADAAASVAPAESSAPTETPSTAESHLYSCLLATHLLTDHAGGIMPRAVAASVRAAQALVREFQRAPRATIAAQAPLLRALKHYLESLLRRCDQMAEGSVQDGFHGLADEPDVEYLVVTLCDRRAISDTRSPLTVQPQPAMAVILLLLSSPSRRKVLHDRLSGVGYRAEVLASPLDLLRRCRQGPCPSAILCDNRASTRHLQTLQRMQRRQGWVELPSLELPPLSVPLVALPPLILVAFGRRSVARRQARILRAAGAWTYPYALAELAEILSRISTER